MRRCSAALADRSSFIRNTKPRQLTVSPALDPDVRATLMESLPRHTAPPAQRPSTAPALPPKPRPQAESESLSPPPASPGLLAPDDPYAGLDGLTSANGQFAFGSVDGDDLASPRPLMPERTATNEALF